MNQIRTQKTDGRETEPGNGSIPEGGSDATVGSYHRVIAIEHAVRGALKVLTTAERSIIEGYYFDGRSLGQLANSRGAPVNLVRMTHRRALAKLEEALRPFVERMFGLSAIRQPDCAICRASWRAVAEEILDSRTTEITWGQIAVRIRRAVNWQAPSPQVLITHQRKHRRFERTSTAQPKGELV